MATRDPNAIAQAWASRLAQSGQKITEGVQGVTIAPGTAAARQADAYAQNVAAAVPKWKARVSAVPLQDWQQSMIAKGVPRVAAGATAAQPKFATFMTQLLPHIDSVKATLPPRGGLDQNIARMTAMVVGMSKFRQR